MIIFGVVLYSTGALFAAAADANGPVFSFWRLWMGVAVLGVAAIVGVRFKWVPWPPLRSREGQRAWRWAGWAGLWFGAQQLSFFTAVQQTSVTDVLLMNTLTPILVGLVAAPLFGERPGMAFRVWTLVAIGGSAIVIAGGSVGPDGNPAGMALAVISTVSFTGFFVVSKLGRADIAVLPFLFGTIVVAAITVSIFVVVTNQAVSAVTSRDLLFTATIAVGPGAVGHAVMTWPLRWVAANVPPLLRLGQPAIAGWLAFWLLGQPITEAHLTGGTLTLVGVGGALLGAGGRRLRARPGATDADEGDGTP